VNEWAGIDHDETFAVRSMGVSERCGGSRILRNNIRGQSRTQKKECMETAEEESKINK
jgi:hypothetical protein